MSKPIEDYGFIGNAITGALVSRDGSIDWLCLPRHDCDACFCALLGDQRHGYWQIRPRGELLAIRRRYRPGTAVLETTFETADGVVTVVDFIPPTDDEHYVSLMRQVRCDSGRVEMAMELVVRMGYGRIVPWVRRVEHGLSLVAGPDALLLATPVPLDNHDLRTEAVFTLDAGDEVPFVLAYHPSHWPARPPGDCRQRLRETTDWWHDWLRRGHFGGEPVHRWHDAVVRSLITLKALSFQPTGGIVAASTTSLPERIGGVRNWDYRYCWVRDSTLSQYALLTSGHHEEAAAWRHWLLRAAAGDPSQLQIMYGLHGERRLTEFELPWLPGYQGSQPVRVGNAAFAQRQLDVPGEVMDTLHAGRKFELEHDADAWNFQCLMLERLSHEWHKPDHGIWEERGDPRHFTHSRLMCWVAFDRGVKAVEQFGLHGPVERWRSIRGQIRQDIETHGWHRHKRAFVQYYGGDGLDASLLLIPELGFLPADDPRFVDTVAAIERELMVDGLVRRYRTDQTDDGLPPGEGVFLACSFWLADAWVLLGRHDEARALFERLLTLRNDLGLLAEEYDPDAGRLLGNFPQAFSHIALINTASNLHSAHGMAEQRAEDRSPAGTGRDR